MLINQLLDNGACGLVGIVTIVHLAEHQRAIEQHCVSVGKVIRLSSPDSFAHTTKHIAQGWFVRSRGLMHRISGIGKFHGGIDEHTSLEIRVVEPDVEDIEHGQQELLEYITSQMDRGPLSCLRFQLVTIHDCGNDKILFAADMHVKSRLRHTGIGDNPLNYHRVEFVRLGKSHHYVTKAINGHISRQSIKRIQLRRAFIVRNISPDLIEAEGKSVRGFRRPEQAHRILNQRRSSLNYTVQPLAATAAC